MKTLISPSLLAANFLNLQGEMEMINKSEADWLHLDVMDGMFVPNISFGFPVIEAVAKVCKKPLDVHFMIEQPERYIKQTAKTGAKKLPTRLILHKKNFFAEKLKFLLIVHFILTACLSQMKICTPSATRILRI